MPFVFVRLLFGVNHAYFLFHMQVHMQAEVKA